MPDKDPLSIDFSGLSLKTPLVLLSGCVGFGDEYTPGRRLFARRNRSDLPQGNHSRTPPGQPAAPAGGNPGRLTEFDRSAEPRRGCGHS